MRVEYDLVDVTVSYGPIVVVALYHISVMDVQQSQQIHIRFAVKTARVPSESTRPQ